MKIRACYTIFLFLLFAFTAIGQSPVESTRFKYINGNGKDKVGSVEYSFSQKVSTTESLYFKTKGEEQHNVDISEERNSFVLRVKNLDLPNYKNKDPEKNFLLIIARKCIDTSPNCRVSTFEIKELKKVLKKDKTAIEIPFSITKNGPGLINVRFGIVSEALENKSEGQCDKDSFTFSFVASGLMEDADKDGIADEKDNCKYIPNGNQNDIDGDGIGDPCDNCPNKANSDQKDDDGDGAGNACDQCPNQDDSTCNLPLERARKAWNDPNSQTLNGLCNFYRAHSPQEYRDKAKNAIHQLEKEAWTSAKRKNTVTAYREYLNFLNDCPISIRYEREARRQINALVLSKKWADLKLKNDKQSIIDFFHTRGNYKGEVKTYLQENFPSLDPQKVVNDAKTQCILQIGDRAFKPRFKDISLDEGIVIDDTKWDSTGILNIKIDKQGNYKILVQDSIGRKHTFSFGYQFSATEVDEEEQYTIEIEGGTPPYQVSLYDEENHPILQKEFASPKIVLQKEALVKQGYVGVHQVTVKHSYDNLDELILKEKLVLKKLLSVQLISAIILIICVIVLSVILFLFNRKRNKKHQSITYS